MIKRSAVHSANRLTKISLLLKLVVLSANTNEAAAPPSMTARFSGTSKRILRMPSRLRFSSCLAAVALSIVTLNPVWADDTEIFFPNNTTVNTGQPNVLIVLDGSGSMDNLDGGNTTRLDRMVNAMNQLLDTLQGTNVGLMRFSHDEGGRILFPVMDLDEQVCGFGPCMSVRDHLKKLLSEFEEAGSTPTISALLEAINYFDGKPVEFGKRRSANNSNNSRYSRVSNPLSYTGGKPNIPNGCDPINNPNSASCRQETITGNPVYISPIEHECQANHIILLTDGAPRGTSGIAQAKTLVGGSCAITPGIEDGQCGPELAAYMASQKNIITHTIGFNFSSPWLETVADASIGPRSQGTSHEARSADDLVTTLNAIFGQVEEIDTTFVAPGATIDQFTRLSHREDVYLAMFQPSARAGWQGNLKRYSLRGTPPALRDQNDQLAIDPQTGTFVPTARSFWSNSIDGAEVTEGGAANQLLFDGSNFNNRNIVTRFAGEDFLMGLENRISVGNKNITTADVGGAVDADEKDDIIQWLRGVDVRDDDQDNSTTDARQFMGDPLHSRPVIIDYGTPAAPESVTFVGTNEGFLHAIDAETGREMYAYMPLELMGNLKSLYDNNYTSPEDRPYGVDGDLVVRRQDLNTNGVIDGSDKAHIYTGLRRGGRNYYALDVSNKNDPVFEWQIEGGTGYATELGETWSKLTMAKIRVGNLIRQVAIFGGGYDNDQDDHYTRTPDGVGRAIYIVDIDTSELLWAGSINTAGSNKIEHFPDMEYSFPSNVKVVALGEESLATQFYIGDMGGRIWRFDINNGEAAGDKLVDGGIIADFAADNSAADARRFYHEPDLSLSMVDGKRVINIAIGSGFQAHPLDEIIEDKFFLVRYPYEDTGNYGIQNGKGGYRPIELNDLFDTTDNLIQEGTPKQQEAARMALDAAQGWRIDLDSPGEKILGQSSTINNVIRFISYVPNTGTDICLPDIGSSRFYQVNLEDGSSTTDNPADTRSGNKRRYLDIPGGGIAPPIQTLFVPNKDGTKVVPSAVSGPQVLWEGDSNNLLQRLYWSESPQ